MLAPVHRILARDGIVTRARIVAEGGSDRWIRTTVASGELTRLRRGVFALPDLEPTVGAAVAAGGRLACVGELRRLGVWIAGGQRTHIHLPAHGSRRPVSAGLIVRHWSPLRRLPSPTSVAPLDALVQAASCLAAPELVAAVDSALHLGLVVGEDLAGIRPALDSALSKADGAAESGLESLMRLALRELGLQVRSQASIVGIGSVDLLVEGRVIVETDGEEHHGTAAARRRDRDRDAIAMASGFTPLRFGYEQVMFRRDLAARAVINAVRVHRGVKGSGRIAASAQHRLDARRVT